MAGDGLPEDGASTSPGSERLGHLARGTFWGLLGEGIALPTALVLTAFLTRRFDPDEFGVLALAITMVTWLQWTLTSPLNRSAVKLVSEADQRDAAIRTVVLAYTLLGVAGAALVVVAGGPIASFLGEPAIAPYVRLLALEMFFACLTVAYRSGLVGSGQFGYRAGGSALRWTVRMVLIVALVEAGLGLYGVILGGVGSWMAELAYARRRIRLSPFRGPRMSFRPLVAVAGPLVFIAFATRFVESADLFFLQALSRDTAEAGYYGAARSLALVPAFLSAAAAMPILATLGHMTREGDHEAARALGRTSIRTLLILAPLAAVASGSTGEIVGLIMGPEFGPAATPMSLLLPSAVAMLGVKLSVLVLTAADRYRLTMLVGGLLPPAAVGAYLLLVPRYGGVGAAGATLAVAVGGAVALLWAVERVWSGSLPAGTAWRAAALSVAGFVAARATPVSDLFVVPKLSLLAMAVLGGFALTGEFDAEERALLRRVPSRMTSWLRLGRGADADGPEAP
ncbi:MAG TPA: oligosaccharide flippase family protein [Longimicrobiales bacterium]|jgi:O-antigen/teichoic acid export membrane protein